MRILIALVAGLVAVDARSATVIVVNAAGQPVASGSVICVEPAASSAVPVAAGRANITGSCRRARCEADGFLPGEVELVTDSPRCVLRPATIVRCEAPAAAAGLEVRLLRSSKGGDAVETIPVPAAAAGAASTRFALPPVAPGRYALELARAKDGWSCRADLGPLGPGAHPVTAAWREPASIGVQVKGGDGRPVAGASVRTWTGRPRESEHARLATSLGAWICGASAVPPRVTDAAGAVRVALDLSSEALLVAGDLKDPRGLAYATLEKPPADAVTMTLALPVRLRAKVENEKDQSIACDASLVDLPVDLSWLTSVITGAAVTSACDARGAIALGPLPSAALHLEVRPRVGLPLRVAVDPPAPGATADLGVLRVRNGESIRVAVQDDLGSPVPGARVTARGSAGILLSVAGVTGDDGGVDLSGIPKNASIAFDVKAKGFLEAHQSHLELDDSPFVVKLARGAAISGSVQDLDGHPVEGAAIALTGEKSDSRRVEQGDDKGAFSFDGVDDGAYRLTARAPGFSPSEPAAVDVRDHRSAEGVTLTLSPAQGISGRVLDAAGSPVTGARVRLVPGRPDEDLERMTPSAEATSGSDGGYTLPAAAAPEAWIVATKPGFGPCAVRAADAAAPAADVVLTLTDPASLVVHVPQGSHTSLRLHVADGAGVGRTVPLAGAPDVALADLAPGSGSAGLVSRSDKSVTLVARETAEITLDAAAAFEGRVTFEETPAPRVYVRAMHESATGQLEEGGGAFTDDRGRYRIDGLSGDSYRVVAVGEDGRAETKQDVADGETARLDLALRSVRLIVTVTDGATNKPVSGAYVGTAPTGSTCSSMTGTSSWGDPGELGFEVSVGSNGCLETQTNAAGVARLSLAAPGSYDVEVGDEAYESWKQPLALGDGTTSRRVALTRKPDRSGDKPHVVANLKTDPPGLSGTVICIAGDNTNSSSPVAGRFDCGAMVPGPGEIRFHVEGYGSGRAGFEVPQSGELVVDVEVPRGGTVVVPIAQETSGRPLLVDASGLAWSDPGGHGRIEASLENVTQVGRAWVFRDVPPSTYTVTVDGKARTPVPLAPGGTAVAY